MGLLRLLPKLDVVGSSPIARSCKIRTYSNPRKRGFFFVHRVLHKGGRGSSRVKF